eukprot:4749696-Prymnesium_polylepis.1
MNVDHTLHLVKRPDASGNQLAPHRRAARRGKIKRTAKQRPVAAAAWRVSRLCRRSARGRGDSRTNSNAARERMPSGGRRG